MKTNNVGDVMQNVIDIKTGEPIESLPFEQVGAEKIIRMLCRLGYSEESLNTFGGQEMMNQIIKFVENNSGLTREEIFSKVAGE